MDGWSMARHNRYEELKMLLETEEHDPDDQDDKGNTILLIACQNGLRRICKLAMRHGCSINAQNLAGNTALHFCFMFGFGHELGEYLKQKGADDTLVNKRGQTCYHCELKRLTSKSSAPGDHEEGGDTPSFADGDPGFDAFVAEFVLGSKTETQIETVPDSSATATPLALVMEAPGEREVTAPRRRPPPISPPPREATSSGRRDSGKNASKSPFVRKATVKRPPPRAPHPLDIVSYAHDNAAADGGLSIEGWCSPARDDDCAPRSPNARGAAKVMADEKETMQARNNAAVECSLPALTASSNVPSVTGCAVPSSNDYATATREGKGCAHTPVLQNEVGDQAGESAPFATTGGAAHGAGHRRGATGEPNQSPSTDGGGAHAAAQSAVPKHSPDGARFEVAASRALMQSQSPSSRATASGGKKETPTLTPIRTPPRLSAFPSSPQAKGEGSQMLLMEALAANDTDAMKLTLPAASEREVHAAMLNACARGNADGVEVLLARAGEASISQGLVVCARSGHLGIVSNLLPRCDAQLLSTALLQSATRNHVQMLKLLLSHQMGPDAVRRALLSCAAKGHVESTKMLLPYVLTGQGEGEEACRLALLASCTHGQTAIAGQLLEALPEVSLDQPLAIAAAKNHIDLTSVLVGIFQRRNTEQDRTACHHALQVALRKNATGVAEQLRDALGIDADSALARHHSAVHMRTPLPQT